ncbi:hypothetical protein M6D93_09755 [Jatrophihabitans telluris]|uniref:GH26 domain-containing protein n=1 Tax=Jatrophihabitans telluris TaxID=2038343 RepID=A0ABY4R3Q4_9ACTN|nr:glycosyl hydrolase [Jatrophihabitans telluris]UQX90265.1 hypothetical protein M6D93_09755 [Jatrophihabitans telluris]
MRPKPATPIPRFYGLDVPNGSAAAFTEFAKSVGTPPTVSSVFIKLDSPGITAALAAVPAGVTPMVSLEPWSQHSRWGDAQQSRYTLAALSSGTFDAQLRAVGSELAAAQRPLYLRFAHEMNGAWYPWAQAVNGNQAGQYIAAWRHVHDLIAPILGQRTSWVWAPNIFAGTPKGAPRLAGLYPGDDYVDLVGLSGYSHGDSVASTYCPTVAALQHLSTRPLLLAEIGVEGSEQASWLAQLGPFMAANPRIRGFVYYDTTPETTGATGYYRIDKNPASVQALRTSLSGLGIGGGAAVTGAAVTGAAAGQRC